MSDGIDTLKFLVENAGVVGTLFILLMATPLIAIIIMYRLQTKSLDCQGSKLDTLNSSILTLSADIADLAENVGLLTGQLTGHIQGIVSAVQLMSSQRGA